MNTAGFEPGSVQEVHLVSECDDMINPLLAEGTLGAITASAFGDGCTVVWVDNDYQIHLTNDQCRELGLWLVQRSNTKEPKPITQDSPDP